LEELRKQVPDATRVKDLADIACLSLRATWDRWHLAKLADSQEFSKLIRELGDSSSELNRNGRFPAAKVGQILGLLRRAGEVGVPTQKHMDAGAIRQLLDDLRQCLEDGDLIEASQVAACRFPGMIADEFKRVTGGLIKGLEAKPPTGWQADVSLNVLLCDLRPYSGDRRCRPYELFLFAAQKHLLEDKACPQTQLA
jgi:hypothetical protein